jgi:hypothetical protein
MTTTPGAKSRTFCAILGFAALIVTSCATEDVVVATLDQGSTSDAGTSDAGTSDAGTCTNNADCQPTAYCAKDSCAAMTGSCRLRPLLCDANSSPHCGCDGVTYWNDCLRMQSGAAAATNGECAVAATCTNSDATDCPVEGASCARLLPGGPNCPNDTIGACWVLPPDCPTGAAPSERWHTCDAPNNCEDTCAAIRSGTPHQRNFGPGCQ